MMTMGTPIITCQAVLLLMVTVFVAPHLAEQAPELNVGQAQNIAQTCGKVHEVFAEILPEYIAQNDALSDTQLKPRLCATLYRYWFSNPAALKYCLQWMDRDLDKLATWLRSKTRLGLAYIIDSRRNKKRVDDLCPNESIPK